MLVTVKISSANIPNLPYLKTFQKVLGKKYELELIFATPTLMKKIHKKNANVLSYPLTKTNGQIFLEPSLIKKEAKNYDRDYREHMWALFVHGLLHLKGFDHGSAMEAREKVLCKEI